MVIDHVGVMLFPDALWLRCLGRISMPIFAFMVAEGCRHTRDMKRYFLRIFILGALCQIVYFVVYKTLYLSTLISFSLAILAISILEGLRREKDKKQILRYGFFGILLLALMIFLLYPPHFMEQYELLLDYGIFPFAIPIILYYIPTKEWRILILIPILFLLALTLEWEQFFAFLALPILLAYNGKRGERNLKYLFYVAYPLHLVMIFLVFLLFFQK